MHQGTIAYCEHLFVLQVQSPAAGPPEDFAANFTGLAGAMPRLQREAFLQSDEEAAPPVTVQQPAGNAPRQDTPPAHQASRDALLLIRWYWHACTFISMLSKGAAQWDKMPE